ncbi:FAD-dependent oxidoreductase [Paraburkholderia caribensis]|nr:FAD-dependent oxidoreductase [Paraburkholderia caribensis]
MNLQGKAPNDPSWWFEEALRSEGVQPAAPALTGVLTVDVVIVGGGYTGLWTALALKERAPHLIVALIESSQCGSGASGKNGGKVSGYWPSLTGIAGNIGPDAALAVARAGTRAQDAIRLFATEPGRDVWWRENGHMRVSAAPAQDAQIATYLDTARQLGVPDTVRSLTPEEVQEICGSRFPGGRIFPRGRDCPTSTSGAPVASCGDCCGCEGIRRHADDSARRLPRVAAAIPKTFGLRIGTR